MSIAKHNTVYPYNIWHRRPTKDGATHKECEDTFHNVLELTRNIAANGGGTVIVSDKATTQLEVLVSSTTGGALLLDKAHSDALKQIAHDAMSADIPDVYIDDDMAREFMIADALMTSENEYNPVVHFDTALELGRYFVAHARIDL